MSNKIKDFFLKIYESFQKLNNLRKVLLSIIIASIVSLAFFSLTYSTDKEYVLLFQKPLSQEDYGLITAELQKNEEIFETSKDSLILVKDEKTGARIRMQLVQKDLLPKKIKGWELFDMESWTSTEFDRNVKLRRAVAGEIKKHIESLNWVESSQVSIAVPQSSLYTDRARDVSAAITITPAEGFYDNLKDKKIMIGIENIISKGIDGINRENIVITDHNGNELNNFSEDSYEDNIKQAIAENKVKDREIRKIKRKVEEALNGVLNIDRYRVAVDLEVNFNRKTIDQKEIIPVTLKPKTPGLPYDNSVIVENIKVSEKETIENFEGLGFIPEGPAGQEPNIPPGYKESIDGRNKYNKNEKINNYVNGEKNIKQIDDAMEIEKKSVSLTIDGIWEILRDENGDPLIENGLIKREYIPMTKENIKKFEEVIKGAINFDVSRGDKVVVKNIAFDRQSEFSINDADYLRTDRIIRYSLYFLAFIIIGTMLFFISSRVLTLYKEKIERIKQEKIALRNLQRDKVLTELETISKDKLLLTQDEKNFIELQEDVLSLVKKDIKGSAKIIRMWLSDTKINV